MDLVDASEVLRDLSERFPDTEMILRSPLGAHSDDTFAVEIRCDPRKLSELGELLEILRLPSSRAKQRARPEGELVGYDGHAAFRLNRDSPPPQTEDDVTVWLVITTPVMS